MEDLSAHACLIYSNFPTAEWRLRSKNRTATVAVSGPLWSNDVLALRRAALSGMGMGMLPLFAVAPHLETGQLVRVLAGWEPDSLPVHALYVSRTYLPASVRAFIDFVIGMF